jgi:hypothetical protein
MAGAQHFKAEGMLPLSSIIFQVRTNGERQPDELWWNTATVGDRSF